MKNIQIIARISAFFLLLCAVAPRHAAAQADSSQGIWWGVERKFNGENWTSAASVPEVGDPHIVAGRIFTTRDSLKSPTGQFSARSAATQKSFTMSLDAKFLTKNGADDVEYWFEPALYVERGAKARLRVTAKVVSKAEVRVNAPQKPDTYSTALATIRCIAVTGKNALESDYIKLGI